MKRSEFIPNIMIRNCNLTRNDPVRLFFYYAIWFVLYNMFAHTIEKLLGLPTIVMWYDLVVLSLFTMAYAHNIYWLMAIMDVKAGATTKTKEP